MTVAYVSDTERITPGGNTDIHDVTHSLGSGTKRALFIITFSEADTDVTSATFDQGGSDEKSATFELQHDTPGTGTIRIEVWWVTIDDAVSSGNKTIRVVCSPDTDDFHYLVIEVSGADATDPIEGTPTTNDAASGNPTVTHTMADTDGIAIGAVQIRDKANGPFTPDADYTEIFDNINDNQTTGSCFCVGYRDISSTGSDTYAPTPDGGTDDWIAVLFEVAAAVVAAGSPLTANRMLGIGI